MAVANFTYESTWQESQQVNWRVEDLIGPDKPMNFNRPFLPDNMVGVADLTCLNSQEKLLLNHIRGNSYLHLFILVEAFIVPTVVDQVRRIGHSNGPATQALLGFAEEEGKHICLFQEFMKALEQGFHHHCDCVGPLDDIAQEILTYPPLSVLLLTLQFEWTTQIHYLESIRHQAQELDPRFCDLLKHHWMEEAQHTKLDTLLVQELVETMASDELDKAIADYFELVQLLEQTLMTQAQLDVTSLVKLLAEPSANPHMLTQKEQQTLYATQTQAYRWAFLCAGIAHPNFVQVLEHISPQAKDRAIQLAKTLSH